MDPVSEKKVRQSSKYSDSWDCLDRNNTVVTEDPHEKDRDDRVHEKKTKQKRGRPFIRTFWFGDELDKKELMVTQPIRKSDVIGGRKMVFYQYRPDLYNPQRTNFAGRRKSAKTSNYRGVYWNKNHHKWEVKIKLVGKTFSLGFFEVEEAAARKYDKFITKFVINRLAINFPEDIGGVKLSVADLVSEDTESVDEANERVKERIQKKVQDLAIDFGLDDPEEVANGCSEWPVDPSDKVEDTNGDDSG